MFNKNHYKHIIWDWNGTLLNDGWLFVEIMNTILAKRRMVPINLSRYRDIFCFPIKDYYIKLGFDLRKEPFEECGMDFIYEYKKRRFEASLYPLVPTLLQKLKILGITHSILSAQHQKLLDELIKFYKLQDYFINILGLNNHYAESKIDNGIQWIEKINIDKKQILMIGDTEHDCEVANAMHIDCILLKQGHNSSKRLEKTNATILNDLEDVNDFFI